MIVGIAATFRVSSDTQVVSAADRRLPNTDVVLGLLKWIERYVSHHFKLDYYHWTIRNFDAKF